MHYLRINDAKSPDPVRRRLSKCGLATPVILSTLGSRPVFGEVAYSCTISGLLSGNTSAHGPPVVCALGDGPDALLAQGGTDLDVAFNSLSSGGSTLVNALESVDPTCTAPSQTGTEAGVVPPTGPKLGGRHPRDPRGARRKASIWMPTAATDPGSTTRSTARFVRVADTTESRLFQGIPAARQHDFGNGNNRDKRRGRIPNEPPMSSPVPETNAKPGNTCPAEQGTMPEAGELPLVVDARDQRLRGRRKPATLRQVLESRDSGIIPLARATIASYLNARRFEPNYALTPKQVIDIFNTVYITGSYRVNESTLWSANQVQTYFETLYR